MRKIVLSVVLLLALGGCGSQATEQKVTPLTTQTTLPADGIITKAQLQTIATKDQTYAFNGRSGAIQYQWRYLGKQIQNPVQQKLRLKFETKQLAAIKKAADHATDALGLTIAPMQLAGTPELVVTLPKTWQADQVVLVRAHKGQLKKVSGSPVTLTKTNHQTRLRFQVLESGVKYYLVGGKTNQAVKTTAEKAAAAAQPATEAGQTGTSQADPQKTAATNQVVNSATKASESKAAAPATSQVAAETKPADDQTTSAAGASHTAADTTEQKPATQTAQPTVTFSISAANVLDHLSELKKEKQPYVPKDGWIVKPEQVPLKPNESVYDLLVKVTKEKKIQMEADWTPVYNAYYVAGINQLYEFDCGSLSGWTYEVNGWSPNYGASKYTNLKAGDTISWDYTLELGHDLGNSLK